jgi:hypothetical protein
MNIIVIASPGYSPHERPHSFIVDEDHYDIAAIEVRILEPDSDNLPNLPARSLHRDFSLIQNRPSVLSGYEPENSIGDLPSVSITDGHTSSQKENAPLRALSVFLRALSERCLTPDERPAYFEKAEQSQL